MNDVERAILAAPLKMSQARWTSEDLARETGFSQSAVARTWRKYFAPSDDTVSLPSAIEIVGFIHSGGHSFIFANQKIDSGQLSDQITGQHMRSPRRIPIQTMLAVQAQANGSQNTSVDLGGMIMDSEAQLLVLGTAAQVIGLPQEVSYKYVPDWQGLLPFLIKAAHLTRAAHLHELHQQLIAWAHTQQTQFTWKGSTDRASEVPASTPRSHRVRSSQQVIADDVFEAIIELVWTGKLTAGDRITESSLARKMHTTRNQTRDALRTLASAGLVDHHPVRGVLVPSPRQTDITDIYTARRALGTEIIRRVIENPQANLEPVEAALNELIRIGKTGNSYASGNADLFLQDALAYSSGMRNIPQMFELLAKQLRLYITVMGMTYLYSIEAMVSDDVTLYKQLVTRNLAGATQTWNKKINDAVTFMTGHVNRK